eukprot:TRINITY_DN5143_c0_g1_i3.p1 TRINITY_DN5143_c0_g1~~TRINITY_DN5143_c0_g1_i3.p1  ORF type:complete len:379 (+),score=54.58 TRINITY_DN5143_c0_g1_i3:63-1199(+)
MSTKSFAGVSPRAGAPFVTKAPEKSNVEVERDQARAEVQLLKELVAGLEYKVQNTDTIIAGLKQQHTKEISNLHSRQASELAAVRAQLPKSSSFRPAHLGPDPNPPTPSANSAKTVKPPTPRSSAEQQLEIATAELRKKDEIISAKDAEIAQLKRDVQLLARKNSLPNLQHSASGATPRTGSTPTPRAGSTPRTSSTPRTGASPRSSARQEPETSATAESNDASSSSVPTPLPLYRRSSLDGPSDDGDAERADELKANELEIQRESSRGSTLEAASSSASLKTSPSFQSRLKAQSSSRHSTPRRNVEAGAAAEEPDRRTVAKERSELLKEPEFEDPAVEQNAESQALTDVDPVPESTRSVPRSPSQPGSARRPHSAKE